MFPRPRRLSTCYCPLDPTSARNRRSGNVEVGKLRVMKARIPANEGERLAALYKYDVLDRFLQEELEGVVRLSTTITGASMAVVNMIDAKRQWQVCAIGMEPGEYTRD